MKFSFGKFHLLAIVAFSLLLYAPALRNGFVFDDRPLILTSPPAARSLGWWSFLVHPAHGFYRPLRTLSFLSDRLFWGSNPWGYHLNGILLHALCGLAYFFLLRSLRFPKTPSVFAVFLFAAHPANVEAVAYASSRSEVLGTLFSLLFLLLFLRHSRGGRAGLAVPALFCLALALLSKETFMVTCVFPWFLLPSLGRRLRSGNGAGASKRAARLFGAGLILTGAFLIFRLFFLPAATDIGRFSRLFSYPQIIIKMPALVFTYLRLLALPVGLSPDHALSIMPLPPPSRFVLQALVLGATIIVVAALGRRSRPARLGGLWLMVSLVPVLNLYPLPRYLAEKYLYFPGLGFSLLLSALWFEAVRISRRTAAGKPLAALIVLFFSALAFARLPVWRSDSSLWRSAVNRRTPSPLALFNYGVSLLEGGEGRRGLTMLQGAEELLPGQPVILERIGDAWRILEEPARALESYRTALERNPGSGALRLKIGLSYDRLGMPEEAARYYRQALSLPPDFPQFYQALELQSAYLELAAWCEKRGDRESAERILGNGLQAFPGHPELLYRAGLLDLRKGRLEGARQRFQQALETGGESAELYLRIGQSLAGDGKLEPAIENIRRAIRLAPENWEPHFELGSLLVALGQFKLAGGAFQRTIELKPDHLQAYLNLGNVHQYLGDYPKAVEAYHRSLSLQENFKARYNLGFLYLNRLNQPGKALVHLEKALASTDDPELRRKLTDAIASARPR